MSWERKLLNVDEMLVRLDRIHYWILHTLLVAVERYGEREER
jgi:hypothetical protein